MLNEFGRIGNRQAIAIVEDDAGMRAMLEDFLSAAGYEVHSYATTGDFLRSLRQAKGYFSLVVSDVHMPGGTGIELLATLSAGAMKLPIIFMTAAPNSEDEQAAARMGALAYLLKPFALTELLQRIRSGLGKVVA